MKIEVVSLVKGEGFRKLVVRDKLNLGYAYISTPSLQISFKNKAGASSSTRFGLSRKLPNAPARLLLTSKKFAK